MFNTFLLKYGEIFLKGKNRYVFEDALIAQVERALSAIEGDFRVSKSQSRLYVECSGDFDYDTTVDALKKVFGIVYICPVRAYEKGDYDKLKKDIVSYIEEVHEKKDFTFKVFAKRAFKNYPVNSQEINCGVGEVLLDAFPGLKVDVHNPEVKLHIEVREKIYVYSISIRGLGGMPVGTAGKGMLLLSGGLDSPVAGYLIAKRGVTLEATYFHAPPYTSERAKQKVIDLGKQVAKYSGPIKLYVVNFTDIQKAIYQLCPQDELTIIMRRYMMQIAEHFAKADDCLGLITGECIGQVASQTMQSLNCTNAVCDLPVYRPVIAFDKQEIMDIAEKIGTYETSILPYEDCCTIFVAEHPVTKPRLDVIEKSEENLKDVIDDLMKQALESVEVVMCE